MLILWGLSVWAAPDVSNALKQSTSFNVAYTASLGEGDGYFDPTSPTVEGTVNCMTWLQWVLAKSYATNEKEMQQYLRDLRYYESVVSFGTRKHYIDRWIALSPKPLASVTNESCRPDILGYVTLETELFKTKHNYSCPMYEEEQRSFSLESLTVPKMTECLSGLPEGYYVMFFVGNERYMDKWGKYGQMGQVHSMIVEKSETILVYHASVDKQRVVAESWPALSERLAPVALGYTIYGLTEHWVPSRQPSTQSLDIVACERGVVQAR